METYLLTFLAWFAACFVNNIAGFGAAMVALPLMGLLGVDMAIAIRTGVIKDGTLYVQAAAGVVADSIAEMEWRETEHKARAVLRAAELVEEGLE